MGRDTHDIAQLNLLLVVLAFGLALLFPWSELWGQLVMREVADKRPRLLKPKTGADRSLCQVEQGRLLKMKGARRLCRDRGGKGRAGTGGRREA